MCVFITGVGAEGQESAEGDNPRLPDATHTT